MNITCDENNNSLSSLRNTDNKEKKNFMGRDKQDLNSMETKL